MLLSVGQKYFHCEAEKAWGTNGIFVRYRVVPNQKCCFITVTDWVHIPTVPRENKLMWFPIIFNHHVPLDCFHTLKESCFFKGVLNLCVLLGYCILAFLWKVSYNKSHTNCMNLGQLSIPQCISPWPATAATMEVRTSKYRCQSPYSRRFHDRVWLFWIFELNLFSWKANAFAKQSFKTDISVFVITA